MRKAALRLMMTAMVLLLGLAAANPGGAAGDTLGLTQHAATTAPEAAEPAASGDTVIIEGADPGFAQGEVVEKLEDGVVLESAEGVRVVRFPPGALVWKEFLVPPDAIEIGDWVDARGTPQPDGSLLARSEWVTVNIGRMEGTLREVWAEGAVVETAGGNRTIEFSPALEVLPSPGGSPAEEGAALLREGQAVGMVGLRLRDGGFRATRIWIYAD